jgi:hypothetical protein
MAASLIKEPGRGLASRCRWLREPIEVIRGTAPGLCQLLGNSRMKKSKPPNAKLSSRGR